MMDKYAMSPRSATEFEADSAQTGEFIDNISAHEPDHPVTDLQWSPDRTYFITASKDKTAKVGGSSALSHVHPEANAI
jgi:translation initiation factor 3 subunit I